MRVTKNTKSVKPREFINPAIFTKVQLENAKTLFLEKIDKAFDNLENGNIEAFDDSVTIEIPLKVIEDIMSKLDKEHIEISIKDKLNFNTFIRELYIPHYTTQMITIYDGVVLSNKYQKMLIDSGEYHDMANVNFKDFTFDYIINENIKSSFEFPYYTEVENEALLITFTLKDFIEEYHNEEVQGSKNGMRKSVISQNDIRLIYGRDAITDYGDESIDPSFDYAFFLNNEEPYDIIKHLNAIFSNQELNGFEGYKNMMLKILTYETI